MTGIKLRIEHSPRALRAFKAAVMLAGFACDSVLWVSIANVCVPRASLVDFLALAGFGELCLGYIFWRAIKGDA